MKTIDCFEVVQFAEGLREGERMARHGLPRVPKSMHGQDSCKVCVGEGFLLGSPVSIKNKAGDIVFMHRPFFHCPKCLGAGMCKDLVDAIETLHYLKLPAFLNIRRVL